MKPDLDAHAGSTGASCLPVVLGVYGCAGNAVLLVPIAVQPPLEASAAHGPLVYRGRVAADPVTSASWREILKQIDRHLFATVGRREFELLIDSRMQVAALDGEAV